MATKKHVVLFARLSPEAKAWALEKADRKKGVSAGTVVERLLMNDKRKQLQRSKSA